MDEIILDLGEIYEDSNDAARNKKYITQYTPYDMIMKGKPNSGSALFEILVISDEAERGQNLQRILR